MTSLEDIDAFERIIADYSSILQARVVHTVSAANKSFPIYVVALGSRDPQAPVVGFFGGVHGLERIGTQILLAFLRTLLERLCWDEVLQRQLSAMRLIFMPLVNPLGMLNGTRSNANGVDWVRLPLDVQ